MKKELKGAKDAKKVLLNNMCLLESKKRFLRAERDGLKSVLKKNLSTVFNKKGRGLGVLFTIDAKYVGVVAQVLPELPRVVR